MLFARAKLFVFINVGKQKYVRQMAVFATFLYVTLIIYFSFLFCLHTV